MPDESSMNISDSVIMGDVSQKFSTSCPSCNATNVIIMSCNRDTCSTQFCQICHPDCRLDYPEIRRFDSGLGSNPLCNKCIIIEINQIKNKEKEAREKEAREKEAREKEAREKEAREKEAREREREYDERLAREGREYMSTLFGDYTNGIFSDMMTTEVTVTKTDEGKFATVFGLISVCFGLFLVVLTFYLPNSTIEEEGIESIFLGTMMFVMGVVSVAVGILIFWHRNKL